MPRTPTERKPAKRRTAGRPRKYSDDLLVAAALRVMEREGYRAMSLRSLAQELNTSHTTLYNYVDAIEEIESKALDELSQQLPAPQFTPGSDLRAQFLAYLLAARGLLLQHPGVLLSPPDSAAGKRLNAVSAQWLSLLQPHFKDPQGGRHALTLLTSVAITSAIRDMVFKSDPGVVKSGRKRLQEARLLKDALGELIDFLLPGLGQGRATRTHRTSRVQS